MEERDVEGDVEGVGEGEGEVKKVRRMVVRMGGVGIFFELGAKEWWLLGWLG